MDVSDPTSNMRMLLRCTTHAIAVPPFPRCITSISNHSRSDTPPIASLVMYSSFVFPTDCIFVRSCNFASFGEGNGNEDVSYTYN